MGFERITEVKNYKGKTKIIQSERDIEELYYDNLYDENLVNMSVEKKTIESLLNYARKNNNFVSDSERKLNLFLMGECVDDENFDSHIYLWKEIIEEINQEKDYIQKYWKYLLFKYAKEGEEKLNITIHNVEIPHDTLNDIDNYENKTKETFLSNLSNILNEGTNLIDGYDKKLLPIFTYNEIYKINKLNSLHTIIIGKFLNIIADIFEGLIGKILELKKDDIKKGLEKLDDNSLNDKQLLSKQVLLNIGFQELLKGNNNVSIKGLSLDSFLKCYNNLPFFKGIINDMNVGIFLKNNSISKLTKIFYKITECRNIFAHNNTENGKRRLEKLNLTIEKLNDIIKKIFGIGNNFLNNSNSLFYNLIKDISNG